MEVIKWVRDSYEKVADEYKGSRSGGLLAVKLLSLIEMYVPKSPGIVIDIGPGNSDNLKAMLERFKGSNYIGCELSLNMIKNSGMLIDWTNCSVTHLPIKDNIADMALALAVLHHIPKSLINIVLGEIMRILKNNGLFIATVWACNETTQRKLIPFNECEGSIPWKHGVERQVDRYYRLYRQGELESEISSVGFKLIASGSIELGRYLNYYVVSMK